MVKIAVIGCGWLGLPLAKKLLQQKYVVFGSTTNSANLSILENFGIIPFLYDGTSADSMPDWSADIDFLILNFPPSKSENYPKQIASILQQFPPTCKVIFTSSTGVYQEIEGNVTEDSGVKKDHPVFLAETEVRIAQQNYTILRLAGLIGPNRHPAKFFSGRTITDANMFVNLVHLNDVVAAIEQIIKHGCENKTFNVCSPEHPKKATYYLEKTKELQIAAPLVEFSDKLGKKVDGSRIAKALHFNYSFEI
jgi:nucleoside-diphosphate-sugar epimerase